ncbi:MAG TPA: Gfo/Idh/MocA family oxidoreductase [Gemmatimonadota bacterium]|jgi:predicted dehydrogenase|nr:Gfo/Idh/MocA family oxidoreductase [Gemmatimonadota bacterium]
MQPLRIALLGCGAVALRHHLPILARMPDVRLVAVAEPDSPRRDAALALLPGARGHADWRAALAETDAQAAIVCLPNADHAEAALAALARGCAVYVEKPLATTLADGDRVVAAWRASGLVGMTGFNYRFIPLYASARKAIAAGELGRLISVRTTFTMSRPDFPDWKRARAAGGGALLDLGSHHADLVLWLFGRRILTAFAELRSRRTEEDTALLQLALDGGPGVQCLFAFGGAGRERFEIEGEKARMIVDRSRYQGVVIEVAGAGSARLRRVGRAAGALRHVPWILEKRRAPGRDPSHVEALARFVAAARAGDPCAPDLEDGRRSLAVLDAAERSARSGRAEAVREGSAEPAGAATRGA